MRTKDILNKEFREQEFSKEHILTEMLNRYKDIASNYAQMENAIAVLSDLHTNTSYIYYGGLAKILGIQNEGRAEVNSIWEEEIFRLIHPDDLSERHLQELCFYHFVKRQPEKCRSDYYLMSNLRMKTPNNAYIPVLHRIFYIHIPSTDTIRLALCLYNNTTFDISAKCTIVNSLTGNTTELDKTDNSKILSPRERQLLALINKGMSSKDIASALFISVNTVSRHRQDILAKLQVRNSIEACRIAKELKLII